MPAGVTREQKAPRYELSRGRLRHRIDGRQPGGQELHTQTTIKPIRSTGRVTTKVPGTAVEDDGDGDDVHWWKIISLAGPDYESNEEVIASALHDQQRFVVESFGD